MDLISTGLRHPRRDPFETHADIFRSIPNWVLNWQEQANVLIDGFWPNCRQFGNNNELLQSAR